MPHTQLASPDEAGDDSSPGRGTHQRLLPLVDEQRQLEVFAAGVDAVQVGLDPGQVPVPGLLHELPHETVAHLRDVEVGRYARQAHHLWSVSVQ